MPSLEATPVLAPAASAADWVAVGLYPSEDNAHERGLVVLAMGAAYWLFPDAEGFRLCVEPAVALNAARQLARYEEERLAWPERQRRPIPRGNAWDFRSPLVWLVAVIVVFWAQNRWVGIVESGLVDSRALFAQGELWRAATALFLHGDIAHLLANGVAGFFVFAAVITEFGRGRGWMLLLMSAVIGNLLAAGFHFSTDYRSLGASTAVFAGVGLLTGRASRRSRGDGVNRRRAFLVPLAAGLIVVGLYGAGAGGVHVDVLAHATGFAAGLLFGAGVEWSNPPRAGNRRTEFRTRS